MKDSIKKYINYLHDVKKISQNTELSYERDLRKMADYFEKNGISDLQYVDVVLLKGYIDFLKQQGMKASTISRSIASIKAFFLREYELGNIDSDITTSLKAPKIEKKVPVILTIKETRQILSQPGNNTDKEIRDKAILELLYATGIRVTELISMKITDVDLLYEKVYITNRSGRQREIHIDKSAVRALKNYIGEVRNRMIGGKEQDALFVNCSGTQMSRQGLWKIIKHYAKMAGIEADITPHTIRHSCAAHMLHSGMDIHDIQKIMGHSDISSTQMYINIDNNSKSNIQEYR